MMQNRYVGILVCDTNGRPPFQDQEFYRGAGRFRKQGGIVRLHLFPCLGVMEAKKNMGLPV